MNKALCVVTIALVLATVVYAQTATGTFAIKGRPMTIMDGKVSKNTLTFKAKLDEQPEGFTGEIAGDEMTLSRDRNGRSDAVTLKRVKK